MEITGEKIKEEREKRGWSQEYLAQITNQSVKTITNHENGSKIPRSKQSAYLRVFSGLSMEHSQPLEEEMGYNIRLNDGLLGNKGSLGMLARWLINNLDTLEKDEIFSLFIDKLKTRGKKEYIQEESETLKGLTEHDISIIKALLAKRNPQTNGS